MLQPADCQGAVFGDKWVGTAYQFYGVKECTEPAGGLDANRFARRMFSDASCGAASSLPMSSNPRGGYSEVRPPLHREAGRHRDRRILPHHPLSSRRRICDPTINAGYPLRDLCDFDVLDELLIADGALTTKRYRALILFQADIVDQPILDKLDAFRRAGGKVIAVGDAPIKNVGAKPGPAPAGSSASRPSRPARMAQGSGPPTRRIPGRGWATRRPLDLPPRQPGLRFQLHGQARRDEAGGPGGHARALRHLG